MPLAALAFDATAQNHRIDMSVSGCNIHFPDDDPWRGCKLSQRHEPGTLSESMAFDFVDFGGRGRESFISLATANYGQIQLTVTGSTNVRGNTRSESQAEANASYSDQFTIASTVHPVGTPVTLTAVLRTELALRSNTKGRNSDIPSVSSRAAFADLEIGINSLQTRLDRYCTEDNGSFEIPDCTGVLKKGETYHRHEFVAAVGDRIDIRGALSGSGFVVGWCDGWHPRCTGSAKASVKAAAAEIYFTSTSDVSLVGASGHNWRRDVGEFIGP
jgi:hypothetical protein